MLNLSVQSHSQVDFVLIDTVKDTKVFIDPVKIIAFAGRNDFCTKAYNYLESFTRELVTAHLNEDDRRFYELCSHAYERNELNLGCKNKSKYGKGIKTKELVKIFKEYFDKVDVLNVKNPFFNSIILGENFAEDKTTDFLSNIILSALVDYTEEQSIHLNLNHKWVEKDEYCWDIEKKNWVLKTIKCLDNDFKGLLLTPKCVVSENYIVKPGKFFKGYFDFLKEQEIYIKLDRKEILTKEYDSDNTKKIIKENYVSEFSRYLVDEILNTKNNNRRIPDERLDYLTKEVTELKAS